MLRRIYNMVLTQHHNLADGHQFGQQILQIFQLEHIGALIRKAVQASLDANYVTEDIDKNNAHSTSEVGEWVVNYIKKA